MFNEPEEGGVRSHMGPSMYNFTSPEKVNSHGLFMFRESEKNLKKTPRVFFFVNLVPQARKSIKQYKGELF
jgi:hypothetical protein